ncbi:MAG TPA: sodium:solute symporter family protein, partial [Planctomycetaceae bacterium]|nr:sodium:solute symporter family protein [Planctomycetaceae bacterium]
AFSFALLPFLLDAVGGLQTLHEKLPADKLTLVAPTEITAFYVAVIALNGLVGIVTQPHVMGCCAAGRTELDGQIGFMGGNLLKRVCTIAWALTGVAAIAYMAEQGRADINPDNVFGEIAYQFLPKILPGLLGLFLAGLLASVMSSCDAFMVSTSGLFTENIYKPLFPDRSPKHYLLIARVSSLFVVVAGVIFAYRLEGVVAGLEIFWKIGPMLGIAFWMGLFWRRMTAVGAWASTLVAFGVWWLTTQSAFINWVDSLPFADEWRLVFIRDGKAMIYLPWQMIFYLCCGALAGVCASLMSRPPEPDRLDRFYALIRTPVTPGETVDAPCTLPRGVTVPPVRKLIPLPSFEIYVPSPQMWVGFVIGWLAVAVLIGTFVWLIS